MTRWLVALIMLFCPSAFAQDTPPEIAFDSVPNLLKMPADTHLGEAAGVAVNSKGNIFVYSRGGTIGPTYGNTASQILEFDRDGNFIREVGKNLYAWAFAHTVRVDKDDNIWATDKGSDMVVKISPEGRVLMVFGRKTESSDREAHPWERNLNPPLPHIDGRFRQPSDVAWDRAGNAYISDGYVNSRVAKISKDGDWIKSWGKKGKGDGEFDLLHTIAVDMNDNVYVGDRNNRRIQVFDSDGKFKTKFSIDVPPPPDARPAIGNMPNLADYLATGGSQTPGAPWAICIPPGASRVMYVSDSFPGRVYKLSLDGKVLGWLGKSGKQLGQFGWVHQMACPTENEIYAAEVLNWRVQKLLLRPAQRAAR